MRVAVIGNGPSPIGRYHGAEIDACDVVVRLHDCHYQNAADYGTQFDNGVLPGPWIDQAARGIRRTPADLTWWVYYFDRLPRLVTTTARFFNFTATNERCQREGQAPSGRDASLSRGFCALVMAMRCHEGAEVLAVGFDALASGQPASTWHHPPAYDNMVASDMKAFPVYHSDLVHHDVAWERAELYASAARHGCGLVWAS